jgi:hypothetical protein
VKTKQTYILLSLLTTVGLSLTQLNAAVLENFESYTLGDDVSIHGYQDTSGGAVGEIVSTTTSGEYIGGLGLQDQDETGAYISGIVTTDFKQTSWSFDFQSNQADNATMYGWVDDAANGFNANAEAQFQIGLISGQFGFRGGSFGTNFQSGVSEVTNNWYRVTAEVLNEGTGEVSLSVYNLTTSADVDLNGVDAGNAFTATLGAQFGSAISSYDGFGIRLDNKAIADNITVIPEPSTLLLTMVAIGLSLLKVRRK